jgi:transposase InsO family protein
MMDFALEGVKWWSLVMLDGYSRTILAGAIAPSEASWVALMVLYTACLRYGAPETLISDSGGAFTSDAFAAVCQRLALQHEPIVSTQGESYKNLMETHFNPTTTPLFDIRVTTRYVAPAYPRAQQEAAYVTSLSDPG